MSSRELRSVTEHDEHDFPSKAQRKKLGISPRGLENAHKSRSWIIVGSGEMEI